MSADDGVNLARVLGEYSSGVPGPTVVISGGVHGNEPSGALAVRDVIAELERRELPVTGRVVGVSGNLAGLARKRRYVDRDLNRKWQPDDLLRMARTPSVERSVEDSEQVALLRVFSPIIENADRPVVFLDLHSTSGPGAPFAAMADVLRNRPIAFALPLPVVLGLEEAIDGTMLGYLCDLGHVGVAVEGGQHEDPETRAHHESMIWIVLVAAGVLKADAITDLPERRAGLARATRGLPRVLEIRHRHQVREDDGFEMVPGFSNFSPIARDQVVANDDSGEVRAPEAGVMMLPRYQPSGDDGYFLARRVRGIWLGMSSAMRRLRLHKVAPLLPGIARHDRLEDHLVAQRRVARFRAPEVFHLFGYRRLRWLDDDARMVFTRRRPDYLGPCPLPAELREALASDGGVSRTTAAG